MLEYEEIEKPERVKQDIWRQHRQWLKVMGEQVDENYARHLARVKEDDGRGKRPGRRA